MPDGVILGARGAYGLMSPKSAAQRLVRGTVYRRPTGVYPVQAPYRDGAGAARPEARGREGDGGQRRQEADRRADRRGPRRTSSGTRRPAASAWRSATAIRRSRTRRSAGPGTTPAKKMVVLDDIQRFAADCVNPPREHEVGGLDQGRLPRRQVRLAAAERPSGACRSGEPSWMAAHRS